MGLLLPICVLLVSSVLSQVSGNIQFSEQIKVELSVEKIQKMLDAILEDIDDDSDDIIEKEELRNWIDESQEYLKKAKCDKLFHELDADEDNQVAWKEFEKDFVNEETKNHKELFDAADQDNDNHLVLDEYLRFRYPTDYPELKALLAKQILEKLDEDDDGKLSFDEARPLVGDRENFDIEDTDDDDYLNEEEVGNALEESVDELLNDTLEILMKADDDANGLLSTEELAEEQELTGKTVLSRFGQELINEGKIKLEQQKEEL